MLEEKPNYKSAYWQNMHWKKQLKEMARNPEAVNEIGFSNFPPAVIRKVKDLRININHPYYYLK